MSWVSMWAVCIRCGHTFCCHPNKVPSIPPAPGHPVEPVCKVCFEVLQDLRKKMGLSPWPDPLPGAYEPAPEDEIDWEGKPRPA